MKFTYGFARKKIHGKEYLYFWKYTGTGRKTEQYIGRADKDATERRALQVELEYLQGLQEELTARILEIKVDLADEHLKIESSDEPSKEDKKYFRDLCENVKHPPVKKKVKKKRKKVMQVETAVRP